MGYSLSVGVTDGVYAPRAVEVNEVHAPHISSNGLFLCLFYASLSFITLLRTSPARRDYAWAVRRLLCIFSMVQTSGCGVVRMACQHQYTILSYSKLKTQKLKVTYTLT